MKFRTKQDNGVGRNSYGRFTPTHSLSNHPLHGVWFNMISRCKYPSSISYKYYGAKGVSVCDEWHDNFKSFYDWAIENRWEKGLHIDRFPDKKGNYCPSNCRITSAKENQRNRTSNTLLTIDNKTLPIIAWAEISGHSATMISKRFYMGWSHKDCVFKPKTGMGGRPKGIKN